MPHHTPHGETQRDVLPKNVRPIHYDLFFEPDLNTFTFRGVTLIKIDVLEETNTITLHAKELEIIIAEVTTGKKTLLATVSYDKNAERITLSLPETIPQGKAKIIMRYDGLINDGLAGFYRAFYYHNGKKKPMGTTQFEAADARKAFPCWDEPSIKAQFEITFKIPKELDVVSNMAVTSIIPDGNKKIIHFAISPLMTTYLVAFVIGEFEYLEGKTNSGTIVRVITTPGKKEEGRFALDFGIKTLEYYNDFFGVPYPLPKLDMIAIPDFAAGAMENWGLVTYREVALLINPEHSPASMKQRVATFIAHELAHMWFGDLVTMKDWDQLWLNEGFATDTEYMPMNHIYPEWRVYERFISDTFNYALADDGLRSTHPVEVTINHPSEIREIFDAISYSKGASIVRMIRDYLGANVYRKGIQLYMKRHAYGNADTEDLWVALEEVSGKPVKKIMDAWTKEGGYPIITVEQKNENTYTLAQKRFLASGEKLLPEEQKQSWNIPLSYRTGTSRKKKFVLLGKNTTTYRFPDHKKTWFKLNTDQITLARIAYPKELWQKLAVGIERNELSTTDRIGVANDIYSLTKTGEIPATELLDMLIAFRDENDYVVWNEVLAGLGGLSGIIPLEGITRDHLDTYGRHILQPIVSKIGWNEKSTDSHTDKMLRPRILSTYGSFKHTETLSTASQYSHDHVNKNTHINPNLRIAIFRLTAQLGDHTTYDLMMNQHLKAERQEEKMYYLASLGNFRDMSIIDRALAFSLSDDMRNQDMLHFIRGIHRTGAIRFWQFMQEHWGKLYKTYESDIMMLSHMIEDALSGFDTEAHAEEIETFFKEHPTPGTDRAVAKALERIRTRAAWKKRDYASVAKWLEDFSYKASNKTQIA